jgi:hypothetical protein
VANTELVFLHDLEAFRTEVMPGILQKGRFGRGLTAKLLFGSVYTDDGTLFRATLDNEIRKELRAFVAKSAVSGGARPS